MSATDWHNCPLCHPEDFKEYTEETMCVREDSQVCLRENGKLEVFACFECQECGATWKINTLVDKQ